tara:strand:- start:253 stop:582 length:330 start_codon:yes stop_codon:yes gene_type:complete
MNDNTMLAVRLHKDSHNLHLEETPIPTPSNQEVLGKVASAGLAPGVFTILKQGLLRHLPTTLGHEVASTTSAVGDNVGGFQVGERVRMHANPACWQGITDNKGDSELNV